MSRFNGLQRRCGCTHKLPHNRHLVPEHDPRVRVTCQKPWQGMTGSRGAQGAASDFGVPSPPHFNPRGPCAPSRQRARFSCYGSTQPCDPQTGLDFRKRHASGLGDSRRLIPGIDGVKPSLAMRSAIGLRWSSRCQIGSEPLARICDRLIPVGNIARRMDGD